MRVVILKEDNDISDIVSELEHIETITIMEDEDVVSRYTDFNYFNAIKVVDDYPVSEGIIDTVISIELIGAEAIPQIDGVPLVGNKTAAELGLAKESELVNKQKKMQYLVLPEASAQLVRQVYQYIGINNENYTHGYFYECKESNGVYYWEQTNIQPSGSSSGIVLTQILPAGNTTVTFNTIPTVGNYLIDFYTSNGTNYSSLTSGEGSVTLAFEEQATDVTVYCEIKEV